MSMSSAPGAARAVRLSAVVGRELLPSLRELVEPHLNREFQQFAGTTPTDLAARMIPV
jgi:hypothetical protein